MIDNANNEQYKNINLVDLKNKYDDIKSKYDHLLAENEILRKENFNFKDDLKKYKAPQPNNNHLNNHNNNQSIIAPPVLPKPKALIERRRSKIPKVIPRKRLSQYPQRKMMTVDWIPIENNKIKDTQWKRIDDSDIKIPAEFETLFSIKNKPKNNKKGGKDDEKKEEEFDVKLTDNTLNNVDKRSFQRRLQELNSNGISKKRQDTVRKVLKKIKLSSKDIREALLNVDEKKLTRSILYNLLEIVPNLNEQKYVQNKMNQMQMNAFSPITYLSEIEEFFYELSDINHLELRIQLWIFKRKFRDVIDDRYNELYVLLEAFKSIQRSSNLEKGLMMRLSKQIARNTTVRKA